MQLVNPVSSETLEVSPEVFWLEHRLQQKLHSVLAALEPLSQLALTRAQLTDGQPEPQTSSFRT
jgi:hypothetical protein